MVKQPKESSRLSVEELFGKSAFDIEHALGMYAISFCTIPAEGIYDKDGLEPLMSVIESCHIYLIGYLSNPILYTYIKDNDRFREEQELRISLSAIGIGHFALKDGSLIEFPSSLQLGFDFRNAIASAAIREILLAPEADSSFLKHELSKLRIEPSPTSEKK